ncbi:MAG: HAD family hydrolase [Anaerolineae bacterium]|nr:HAD family hydrolase [Anaerolineae bacterium]
MMRFDDVRAVVFDLDGVILESAEIKTVAFLELFGGYPEFRERILEYHLGHLGVSRYDKFEWIYRELLKKPLDGVERERLGQEFSGLVLGKVMGCPFVPGVRELLERWRGSKLMFVASGTPQGELDVILEGRGIAGCFEGAWGSPTKKEEVVRRVLGVYGLARDGVLFVGDGSSDWEAAQATGVRFLARATGELNGYWERMGAETIDDFRLMIGDFGE